MAPKYNLLDIIGVAYFMGESDKYDVLMAGEMAEKSAIAIRQVLGPRPRWNEDDDLGDWESFLIEFIKAMYLNGLDEYSTVKDFNRTLRELLERKGYLKERE
jgi:hypothetical protein